MKRAISVLLLFTMLFSLMTGFSLTAFAAEFKEDTLVEAEDGALTAGALKTKDKDASGGQCIATKNTGEGKIEDPTVLGKPDASYTFNLSSDGTYEVWALYKALDGGHDSFHWWWNDMPYSTKHPGVKEQFTWISLGSATLKAGKNTLNLTHREFGAFFDAFFVTTDPTKVPLGMGGSGSSTAPSAAPTTAPTSSPGTVDTDGAKLFKTEGGSVKFEAEDTVADTNLVNVLSEKEASGGKTVKLTKANKEEQPASAKGGLEFNVEADKPGNYHVWIRYNSTHGGSDSAHMSINGANYSGITLTINSDNEFEYGWKDYGTVSNVSAGGKFSVRIIPRETGAKLDKIIITSNANFMPEGMGELPDPSNEGATQLPGSVYPAPAVTPPADHPRLLIRPSDIPVIKANLDKPQNAEAKKTFEALAERNESGELPSKPGSSNYNATIFTVIEAKAFDYIINGNEENGKQAVKMMLDLLSTADFTNDAYRTRVVGQTLYVSGLVYDWCYPLLTDEDKNFIISTCEIMARMLEVKYPPIGNGAVTGHGGEAQISRDLLSFAVAAYNERPDIYNFVAGRYFKEFIEPRDFWYTSQTHHQGTTYGSYRWGWDMWAAMIFKKMANVDIFDPNIWQVGYHRLYLKRPDGQHFRLGDDTKENSGTPATYWDNFRSYLFYASNNANDPYLKKEYQREVRNMTGFGSGEQGYYSAVTHLIFNNPDLLGKPIQELPKTRYFGSPNGQMIARTGWNDGFNSPDAVALMKIGEVWGANHNHLDAGSFQIYYKGILASESGWYDKYNTPHDLNWNKETIAHNSLLIFDPNEKPHGGAANSGGQRRPGGEPASFEVWMKDNKYETAKVIGHEFGPDPVTPAYSYIKGDITKAYTEKAEEVLRSMLFMPLKDSDHRAAFFVMDKVTSANPEFKKSFLLHSQQEPQINGNVTTIVRDEGRYNGKLVNQTLLPKDAKIEKIGGEGKQFLIGGTNYAPANPPRADGSLEIGWGRVEISPGSANKTDYFLNVMTVKDADSAAADLSSILIEGDSYVGAAVSDKVAIFAKDAERIEGSISFTIPGSGDFDALVAGIKEGTWTVQSAAGTQQAIATKDGGVIYFSAPAGTVTITYKDANAVRPEVTPQAEEYEGVAIKVANMFIYTDVPPTIRNGRTLVPLRAIFEELGAEVSYDEATATATATKEFRTIQITENQTTAYVDGEPEELDVPAIIENGRFLVPVRFVSEALNAKVDWDEHAQIVYITPGKLVPRGEQASGYAKIIDHEATAENNLNFALNSYDNDYETLWACEGEHNIVYELDKEYTIPYAEIIFNQNRNRNAKFELQYSLDGVNFTSVFDGAADGTVGDFVWEKFEFNEPVRAKYIKMIVKGSEISMFNGVVDVRFKAAE